MITLFTFGPQFGLPDPSPFVMKAETLLKMSGLPYRTDGGGFRKAPKGKLPYIDDNGKRLTFRSECLGCCGRIFKAVGVAIPPTIRENG